MGKGSTGVKYDRAAASVSYRGAMGHERLLDQGVEVATGTPQELQQVMGAELKRWSTVIKNAGITVDAPR